jgi:formylglycine-generating enzyme required for sulfatase activity
VGADRVQPVAVVDARQTAPVAGLSSSATGVLDLSGNLWEWQQDWWAQPFAGVDPTGPASGSYRVYRGGSWYDVPLLARVAIRNGSTPGIRGSLLGFRLLRASS